jgi:uncharacterized protein involved in response to NO
MAPMARSDRIPEPLPESLPLLSFGFRPFFLMAAIFSPLAILIWLGIFSGIAAPVSDYPPNLWHGHEMLFGYAVAVLSGFFLTAVPNWTGAPPIRGRKLAGLCIIWLAGRIAIWSVPACPPALAAAIDLLFLPALAVTVLPALRQAPPRNRMFLVILGLLTAANLLFHLEALGIAQTGRAGILLGVDLFALLISIVGGRVTPAFTASALKLRFESRNLAVPEIRSRTLLDRASMLSVALVALCDLAIPNDLLIGLLALAAAALNAWRLAGWQTRHVLYEPLLWAMHLGYAWLVIGLAVKGLAALTGFLPSSIAIHGITIGAIGTMTLAIMSRASLGHTGRKLAAGRTLAVAYLLVSAAALARLFLPLAFPSNYIASMVIASGLWVVAFIVFGAIFVPIFVGPRIDGPSLDR